MNIDKVIPLLNGINKMVSQVRDLLYCPEGIRITIINNKDLSYVEYWDGEASPRIVYAFNRATKEDHLMQFASEAMGLIPISAFQNKKIELYTNIKEEDFSDSIAISVSIFDIKIKELNHETYEQLRGRDDFNNYMSRIEEAQRSTE